MMRKHGKSLNLYQKFTITIIIIGLIPMLFLSTYISNSMISDYREALRSQYEQAAEYLANSLDVIMDSYNSVSKMPYYYNASAPEGKLIDYQSSDYLRKIILGSDYDKEDMEKQRFADMKSFLKYVVGVDGYINSAHFIAKDSEGSELDFHYSPYSTYFKNSLLFKELTDYSDFDTRSNKMILIPTHETGYFSSLSEPVFTIARNYFDLRGQVGNTPYIGTIFIDVDIEKLELLFRTIKFNGNEEFYVIDGKGNCFYSSAMDKNDVDFPEGLSNIKENKDQMVISTKLNDYGLKVMAVINTKDAFSAIRSKQQMMYLFLGASIVALMGSSVFFSKRLTRPIHEMMENMSKLENGIFEIEIPVRSNDEIGVLAQRFNQMSADLKNYINKFYVAQIKQNEAELTALKSQIYPHFLYNTLEIIRMTALEDNSDKVPNMIEALAEQIRYLIGPMQDIVPLEKEVDNIRKYVYLLNCRIAGKIQLVVNAQEASKIMVPKLILQPIVENAYVHGLKPKKGIGSIMVEAAIHDDMLELTVMDNGVGMNEDEINELEKLLEGDEPGIKNEYNWHSIGLKNVHDRIRFLYGEQYGIKISGTKSVGTMVRILMPYRAGED